MPFSDGRLITARLFKWLIIIPIRAAFFPNERENVLPNAVRPFLRLYDECLFSLDSARPPTVTTRRAVITRERTQPVRRVPSYQPFDILSLFFRFSSYTADIFTR